MSPAASRLLTRLAAALALGGAPSCLATTEKESVSCYEPEQQDACSAAADASSHLPRVHSNCSEKEVDVEEGPYEDKAGISRRCCYRVVDRRTYLRDTEMPCGRPLLVAGQARVASVRQGAWGQHGSQEGAEPYAASPAFPSGTRPAAPRSPLTRASTAP